MTRHIPRILLNARRLRHDETSAEIRLWQQLRGRRLIGFKFVRQLPVGHYIADFACRDFKLIVEVDGATHGDVADIAYDARRTEVLQAEGWTMMRFWNEDIFNSLNAVCDAIVIALEKLEDKSVPNVPHPRFADPLPPEGGRGR